MKGIITTFARHMELSLTALSILMERNVVKQKIVLS